MDKKTPQIRFKEFSKDWENRKFIDIFNYERPDKYIVKSTEYNDKFKTPVLTANKGFILGYTNEKNIYKKESIIFDDFTLDSKYINFPYMVKSSAIKILTVKNNQKDNLKCAYYILISSKIESLGHSRHYISIVQNTKVFTPRISEQNKIALIIDSIEKLINLQHNKCNNLILLKSSLLQKMFPKEGESKPNIRFNGFTDDWEQRKFGTIVNSYSDPINTPNTGYTRLGIRSHGKGTFHKYVKPGMELGTSKMYKVGLNNFIVNITFGWEHAVAITDKNDVGKLVSHRFPQFSFSLNMEPNYFKFLILDNDFKHWLMLSSPGGAGRNRVLKLNEMLEYKFWVTKKDEQKKIADCLLKIDNLITLHQHKRDTLKKLKEAMLQKMFA